MRTTTFPFASAVLTCAIIAAASCATRAPDPEFRPTATVKDIMDSIVDPGADGIWDSVEIDATLQGTIEKVPKTDDDWKVLRHHAIAVMEASNLLLVPGRRIAQPGEKAVDERVDLKPEEIESRINADRPAFVKLAHGLQDAAAQNLSAITARDVPKLLDAGDVLDTACENCHRKYWYRVDPGVAPSVRDVREK